MSINISNTKRNNIEYNEKIFDLYREYGYKCSNIGLNPIVFPASGISYIEDQTIFNNLFEGLSVSFVRRESSRFPETTALEIGGEFIGWMPKEIAKNYVEKELPRGYQWEGILKYIYKPEIDSHGEVTKNAGIRVELIPKKSSPEKIEEMLNKLSEIHKDNYNKKDITKLYDIINNDDYYYSKLYDTKTILNAVNILLKNNIEIKNFEKIFSESTEFHSTKEYEKLIKKLFNIYYGHEESFYELINSLTLHVKYRKT